MTTKFAANTLIGNRMRYCQTCEVPVGVMELHEFERLTTCPTCGKPLAGQKPVVVPDEAWITAGCAEAKYAVCAGSVRKAGRRGHIGWIPDGDRTLYLEEDVERIFGRREQ